MVSDNKFLGIFMILSGILLFLFSFKIIFKILILLLAIFLIIYGSQIAGYSGWHVKFADFLKKQKKPLTEFLKKEF